MENSNLVDCAVMSPNHSGKRTHAVDRITPHCVVGQFSAERIGKFFISKDKQASCNYGIGEDGRVCLVVDEDNRSWCSSSPSNDQRAITIECSSDLKPPYAFNDVVYSKLIKLCIDICKRYNKTKLIWIENKKTALSYKPKNNEMQLTVHRWFANKDCPGDWMYERMGDLAERVTKEIQKENKLSTNPYKEPIRDIQKGCSGEDVKWVQWELNQNGANLIIDGIAGNKTNLAIKAFQKKYNLYQDGIVGIKTRTKLKDI